MKKLIQKNNIFLLNIEKEIINIVNKYNFDENDNYIPYNIEWSLKNTNYVLEFSVKGGNSISHKNHDYLINDILNTNIEIFISECYTIETGRYFQVWFKSIEKIRKIKLKDILE